jgi:hypothetical protein
LPTAQVRMEQADLHAANPAHLLLVQAWQPSRANCSANRPAKGWEPVLLLEAEVAGQAQHSA